MASGKYGLIVAFFVALTFSSIDVGVAARHLLQFPPLPKPTSLPPLPSIPTLPQPTLPTLPKPALPPLPSMPTIPTVPKLALPPLPSIPTIPNIPTTIPSIPFFSPPPPSTKSP